MTSSPVCLSYVSREPPQLPACEFCLVIDVGPRAVEHDCPFHPMPQGGCVKVAQLGIPHSVCVLVSVRHPVRRLPPSRLPTSSASKRRVPACSHRTSLTDLVDTLCGWGQALTARFLSIFVLLPTGFLGARNIGVNERGEDFELQPCIVRAHADRTIWCKREGRKVAFPNKFGASTARAERSVVGGREIASRIARPIGPYAKYRTAQGG